MKIKNLLLVSIFLFTISGFSQVTKKFIDTGSVSNQFDYLITKSNKYQVYKVVELNWLTKLKSNVLDSISESKNSILTNLSTIDSQKKTIEQLENSLATSEVTIQTLTNENQSISLAGIQLSKSFFKTLMFSIIGILIISLFFFITKFKQSNRVTIQTKETLKEVEEEFETHRKIALEREQKVMRKLQDELNKQKKE
ncbi:MAG: hypothetical protein HKP59_05550 [Lutibacter sp.]|uniref:hypothetical protein n=1 Tax=Lutibacter sp. TaxID=1925666 RepID=UPI0018021B4E|nr:hypothetical protein [Lutibacter sp.]MBT8317070.1 hypothetical protein [Lutibacter sp.]NNJ57930.1 hypothetical protein [Lutibacter sp.]